VCGISIQSGLTMFRLWIGNGLAVLVAIDVDIKSKSDQITDYCEF
jgi:hypothetical protein